MSLLEKMRRRRDGSSLSYYHSLINREQRETIVEEKVIDDVQVSRSFSHREIEKNKRNEEIQSAKTRLDVKRRMMMKQLEDNSKNQRLVSSKSLNGLIAGFLDSKSKKDYIKLNSTNFKSLATIDQRVLFKIFMDYL